MAKDAKQEKTYTRLEDLAGKHGTTHARKRVGRGSGSGHGKTSARGMKGAQSRSGYSRKTGFEGGQMPLQRRLPKRGFNNIFAKDFSEVNVGRLENFETGATLDTDVLRAAGFVRKVSRDGVKILGAGKIAKALHLKVQGCTASARKKVEGAGGSIEIVALPKAGPKKASE
ncbi:MAG: 50S ribosomal protein L15 [bacterium]|nr:50S ribosomal protein L15 [bacterium]